MPALTDKIKAEGFWEPGVADKPDVPQNVALPNGVDRGGQYYAYYRLYQDGTREVQWFKRDSGGGEGGTGDRVLTTTTEVLPAVRTEWDAAEAKAPPTQTIAGVPHERGPDGVYRPVQTAAGPAAAAATATQKPTGGREGIEGTPRPGGGFDNSQPLWVVRGPDGGVAWTRPLEPAERAQWEREKNAGLGRDPRSETDAERAARADARIKEQGAAAAAATKASQPTVTIKAVKQPDGSTRNVRVLVYPPSAEYPSGREVVEPSTVPGEPAPTTAGKPVRTYTGTDPRTGRPATVTEYDNGHKTYEETKPSQQQSPYVQVQQDKDSGQWFGLTRSGTWEPMQGGPGATKPASTSKAPSLPQIIVGRSQDALRSAYDEIQAEVDGGRRTPAWGENRRKEVYEAAQLAVNEAQLHEQSRQYNQTQAQSLANTRLQYGQDAFSGALRSALSINDKLKPGSRAGGQLFRAAFMMQMQMLHDSGIDAVVPGGGQSSVGRTGPQASSGGPSSDGNPQARPPLVRDIDNHPKLDAVSSQAAANIRAGLEASGAPREYTPASSTVGSGIPPTASAVGVSPTQSVVGVPPAPATGAPPPSPTAPYGGGLFAPGTSGSPPPLPGGQADPGFHRPDLQAPDTADPGFRRPDLQAPDTADPGFRRPDLQGGAPPPLAALASLGEAPPVGMPEPPRVDIPPDLLQGPLPALDAARVAATPPWQLPPDQLDDLAARYGDDVVFGHPLQRRLA